MKSKNINSLQLLSASDVCILLKISKPTFWRLRHSTDFPAAIYINNSTPRWLQEDLFNWIKSKKSY